MSRSRFARRAASVLASAALLSPALASAQRAPLGVSSGGLVPLAGVRALRRAPRVRYGAAPRSRRAAQDAFLREAGSDRWTFTWDAATGVPSRVFGEGIPSPGVMGDPARAEAHARAFLERHLGLFAPGATTDELRLVADDLSDGLRTVIFAQNARAATGAIPVASAHVSVRYKADRLILIASEAIPSVRARAPLLTDASAEGAALAWARRLHGAVALAAPTELVVLPLLREASFEAPTVLRVTVAAELPVSRYAVYVDARSGALVASEQLLRFASGQVDISAPVRGPQGARMAYPARLADVELSGAMAETDDAGQLSWLTPGPTAFQLHATGASVAVTDLAGAPVLGDLTIDDGGAATWALPDDETGDAQLSAFTHARLVKERAKLIDPTSPFLTTQTTFVNVDKADPQGCNAFWDGSALNFMLQHWQCNNTARVADVVYHEFGHGFHQSSALINGPLDPSLGEGGADYMCATTTDDPQIAPGFFLDGGFLREIESDMRWPDDVNPDPHETGRIISGALWDLRTLLSGELGKAAGVALADHLYQAVLKRATNIPASYAEVLAADDDDGNLANGTPHICAINQAFVQHGLAPMVNAAGVTVEHVALSSLPASDAPYPVSVHTKTLYPQCKADPIDSIDAVWGPRGGAAIPASLTQAGDQWTGGIPGQHDGTALEYRIVVSVAGQTTSLPDNYADPAYRVYTGATKPVYCDDFEAQIDGWTHGASKGAGDFEWGTPAGKGGDPGAAHSGTKAIGDNLGLKTNGLYTPNHTLHFESPSIAFEPKSALRLQLRRWLTVEDGAFDQATIYANDQAIWQNASTSTDDGTLSHVDREWRFEDIDLGFALEGAGANTVQIRFEIVSDPAVQMGGWTVDDFCVVAREPPAPIDAGVDAEAGLEELAPDEAPPYELSGGCACDVAPRSRGTSCAALLVAAVALLARRRRRS